MNISQKASTIAAVIAAATVAPASHAVAATHVAAKTQKYKGPQVDTRWGVIQVTISVKSKKITNVNAAVNPHTSRSQFIDEQAIPLLRQEVLQAQSAHIDLVSGATDLSQAYIASLQSAIKAAHSHKALK